MALTEDWLDNGNDGGDYCTCDIEDGSKLDQALEVVRVAFIQRICAVLDYCLPGLKIDQIVDDEYVCLNQDKYTEPGRSQRACCNNKGHEVEQDTDQVTTQEHCGVLP